MKKEHITITPELAKRLLEGNFNNRKFRKRRAMVYVRTMKAGGWVEDAPDGISFTGKGVQDPGRLLNGQHRLWAIIESGVTVRMWVNWGVPAKCFASFDNVLVRTTAERMGKTAWAMEPLSQLAQLVTNENSIQPEDLQSYLPVFEGLSEILNRATKRGLTAAPIRAAWVLRMAEAPEKKETLRALYDLWVTRDYGNLPDHFNRAIAKIDGGNATSDSSKRRTLFALAYRMLEPDREKRVHLTDDAVALMVAEAVASVRRCLDRAL